jgi:Tfp pilus assembly protein PilF
VRRLAAALLAAGAAAAEPATEAGEAARDADYAAAVALIEAGDPAAALAPLLRAEARLPGSADVQSLLGFVSRKAGRLDEAAARYARALRLAPRHAGALEYQGELHLMRGDLPAARANLDRLAAICPAGCEERDELAAAIARYEAAAP